VGGELEHSTLAIGTGGDDTDLELLAIFLGCAQSSNIDRRALESSEHTISWVVNGDDDARSQDNLLPGLANVDHVDAIRSGLPQVRLHVHLEVLAAEVSLRSEEHLDVLLGRVEDRGEIRGSHLVGLGGESVEKGEDEEVVRFRDVELLVEGSNIVVWDG
jgi:hypothetical protein